MTVVTIRAVTKKDEAAWRKLWAAYNAFYGRDVEERTTDRTWHALADETGHPHGFIAEANGQIVGFTHYFFVPSTSDWHPRCYMQDLFADPLVRGQGIGRALIEAVYAEADARESSQVYWLTDASNDVARTLYDRVAHLTPFIKYRR
jgi:GNAT superfamily N-acetyltransferase